mgnify:CR=1 FL=1
MFNFMPSWDLLHMTGIAVTVYGQYQFTGSRFSEASDRNVTLLPEYSILNLGAQYQVKEGLMAQLFVANVRKMRKLVDGLAPVEEDPEDDGLPPIDDEPEPDEDGLDPADEEPEDDPAPMVDVCEDWPLEASLAFSTSTSACAWAALASFSHRFFCWPSLVSHCALADL